MSIATKLAVNLSGRLIVTGASRTRYEFYVYDIGSKFNALPGVYIFIRGNKLTGYDPIYVGQTHDFSGRIADNLGAHHRWPCISRLGATHVCALVIQGGEQARLNVETDIIHALNPPCNRQ